MENFSVEQTAKELTLGWIKSTGQSGDPKKAAEQIATFYLDIIKRLRSNVS